MEAVYDDILDVISLGLGFCHVFRDSATPKRRDSSRITLDEYLPHAKR
jgi:hypothetical protein